MDGDPVSEVPNRILEEALDCMLVRVRWYVMRGHHDRDIPEMTRLAFNYLCDVLKKPDSSPYGRLR